MQAILADLVAEQQALDQFLQKLSTRDWGRPTTSDGWDIQDTVSHLAATEEFAYLAVAEGGAGLPDITSDDDLHAVNQTGVERGRALRPQRVVEWWRESRAKVVEALSVKEADDRITWYFGDMSARSFATVRLMETWAHGLDVHAAVGVDSEDTPRLRHVAWLGWASLPFAFARAGRPYEQIRVEVVGPERRRWTFGPPDSGDVIRGSAAEWCRLVVRRLEAGDAETLVAEGDLAAEALQLARTFP